MYSILFHVKKSVYKIMGVYTVGNSQHHHQTDKGACYCEMKYFSL